MIHLTSRVRVLLVEDSALVRRDLTALLETEPKIAVIGTACDAYVARNMILKLDPDVLLVDVGLPKLDGLSLLRAVMEHRPMPVIIVSGMVAPGSDLRSEAMEAGAFEVFHKPEGALSVKGVSAELTTKVLEAARHCRKTQPASVDTHVLKRRVEARRNQPPAHTHPRQVILMGASTGGTVALHDVLTKLPLNLPGIAIVQHIPAKFSRAFAERLNSQCQFEVREAADGDELHPGLALVAPGGRHMTLHWDGSRHRVRLNEGPRVHHQRPAVDVLFDSAVEAAGAHATAVLLTGMGRDGATGMKRLRDCGATTLAQDEKSCVVFGMPQAAMQIGAAQQMVPLEEIPKVILQTVEFGRRKHNEFATMPG